MSVSRSASTVHEGALRAMAEDAILETLECANPCTEGIAVVDSALLHEMIAATAYRIAEQRGFVPGHQLQDWYRAEAVVNQQLPHLLEQQ